MKNLSIILSVVKVILDLALVVMLVLYLKDYREAALSEIMD